MRKISYRPYLLLLIFFFCVMGMPREASEKIRAVAVCSISPCWRGLNFLKEKTVFFARFSGTLSPESQKELELSKQENLLLHSQMEQVREWLLCEDRLQGQIAQLKAVLPQGEEERAFFLRRNQERRAALALQVQSVPATVVFREPGSWSSALWVNVGEQDNAALRKKIIVPNSPVLVGTSVIGVVEHVGERQSRVRLVTDAHLALSVRAVRGKEQNRYLIEHLDALLFALEVREDLPASSEEIQKTVLQLQHLKNALEPQTQEAYLAKGELHGSGRPLWRSRHQLLRGLGFNYDIADEEGPARDLRTGHPPLLKLGDLLVTTGLDGVFPAGLCVALVSEVQCLKEGASSYEIEAVSTAGDLDDLYHVSILPPLNLSQ